MAEQGGRSVRASRGTGDGVDSRVQTMKSHIVLRLEDFSEIAEWKSEQRRKDAEDIATGRRTPKEVQRENSWLIPHPEKSVTLNLIESCEAL